MTQNILVQWWNSLPETAREWIVKIAVTIVIAVWWHWIQREAKQDYPPSSSSSVATKRPQSVNRKVLEPLPQDLVLEEKIDDEKETERQANDESNDEDDSVQQEEEAADGNAASEHLITSQEETNSPRQSPNRSTTESNGRTLRSWTEPTSAANRPVFRNQSGEHPGLEAFWHWCDVECSLFRIYSLGRKDGTAVHPPFIPRSRRGQVKVSLRVKNRTERTIHVSWINYKGKEEFKGKITPGSQWAQQTWIEHPWGFRDAETDEILLYYIPDRIIPSCDQKPTVDENDPEVGVHRFDLINALPDSPFWIEVQDAVLPFPAKDHIRSPEQAAEWSLLHMHRMNYGHWDVLVKYLTNILHEPARAKFRQLRIANPTFFEAVWQTPARGLLFAMGFVEQGAHAELGTAKRLTADQVKRLSSLMFSVAIWRKRQDTAVQTVSGADGFGRAGFGRAGAMS